MKARVHSFFYSPVSRLLFSLLQMSRKRSLRLDKRVNLFLINDAEEMRDGAGAQIQRLISLYCIAQTFRMHFLKSSINLIDSQNHLTPGESRAPDSAWSTLVEEFLVGFDEKETQHQLQSFRIASTSCAFQLFQLLVLKVFVMITSRNLQVIIPSPRLIADNFPEIFEVLNHHNNHLSADRTKTRPLRVVCHIRQGVLFLPEHQNRLLSFGYYEIILSEIIFVLKALHLNFEVYVLAECGTELFRFYSSDARSIARDVISLPQSQFQIVSVQSNYIEVLYNSPDKNNHPILYANYRKTPESDFCDFQSLLNADIIIGSKSSFSFSAAILNRGAVVVFPKFWHELPQSWIHLNQNDLLTFGVRQDFRKSLIRHFEDFRKGERM